MLNCPRELHIYLASGADIGCVGSSGMAAGLGHDTTRTHPWRYPGTAPITSPCGVAGGNPRGCIGPCATGGYGHGEDLRGRLNNPSVTTSWRADSIQEVKWGNNANHVGGYSYRLCKRPATPAGLTEECFQQTPLDFVGDTQWIEFLGSVKPRIPFKGMTAMGDLTYPPGSQWRRNPIPCCVYTTERGMPCLGTMYPTIDGLGGASPFAGYGPFPGWQIVDKIKIPDIAPGDYVMSWRWDTEEFAQVWSACSHIKITAKAPGPSPPAPEPTPVGPCVGKDISCPAISCAVCGTEIGPCVRDHCPAQVYQPIKTSCTKNETSDTAKKVCNYHCKCGGSETEVLV